MFIKQMADFLSCILNTQNESSMDSQCSNVYSRNESTQEEFNFMGLDSQSEIKDQVPGDHIRVRAESMQEGALEIIREEDVFMLTQNDIDTSMNRKTPQKCGNISSRELHQKEALGPVAEKLSQELDHMEKETQRLSQSVKKEKYDHGNNEQRTGVINVQKQVLPVNYFKNPAGSNMYPQPSSLNFFGNQPPNMSSTKASTFVQKSSSSYMPKAQNELKSISPNHVLGPNQAKQAPNSRGNNPNEFENNSITLNPNLVISPIGQILSEFKMKSDEMISKTIKAMDVFKADFCGFVDYYKFKFKKDAEFMQNLLCAETEYILSEEEKNKMIDNRMDLLFKEMMNILNEFQKFRQFSCDFDK